jgi:hypothetical protein
MESEMAPMTGAPGGMPSIGKQMNADMEKGGLDTLGIDLEETEIIKNVKHKLYIMYFVAFSMLIVLLILAYMLSQEEDPINTTTVQTITGPAFSGGAAGTAAIIANLTSSEQATLAAEIIPLPCLTAAALPCTAQCTRDALVVTQAVTCFGNQCGGSCAVAESCPVGDGDCADPYLATPCVTALTGVLDVIGPAGTTGCQVFLDTNDDSIKQSTEPSSLLTATGGYSLALATGSCATGNEKIRLRTANSDSNTRCMDGMSFSSTLGHRTTFITAPTLVSAGCASAISLSSRPISSPLCTSTKNYKNLPAFWHRISGRKAGRLEDFCTGSVQDWFSTGSHAVTRLEDNANRRAGVSVSGRVARVVSCWLQCARTALITALTLVSVGCASAISLSSRPIPAAGSSAGAEWAVWCWRAGVGCADKAYPSLGFAELELTIGVATGVLGALPELPAAVALEGVLLLSRSVPEIQALRRDMALDFSGVESHLLCDALTGLCLLCRAW